MCCSAAIIVILCCVEQKVSVYNDSKPVCSYCTLQSGNEKYVTTIGCTKSELNV